MAFTHNATEFITIFHLGAQPDIFFFKIGATLSKLALFLTLESDVRHHSFDPEDAILIVNNRTGMIEHPNFTIVLTPEQYFVFGGSALPPETFFEISEIVQ